MPENSGRGRLAGEISGETPETGNADVDSALARLTELETLPTAEHVGIFDDVHARLHEALSSLEGG